MPQPLLLQPTIPWNIQQLIPERHHRLWLLQDNGLGLYIDLSRLIQTHPEYAGDGWSDWKTLRLLKKGVGLRWARGQTLDLLTLWREVRRPTADSSIQILRYISRLDYYRPLMHHLPATCSGQAPATSEEVGERYGIGRTALRELTRQYAAPSELLYRRLLDLSVVLGQALSISEVGVRDLMHWQWRPAYRPTPEPWLTPIMAIQRGELRLVESTLYPCAPGEHL